MPILLLLTIVCAPATRAGQEPTGTLHVRVRSAAAPIADAVVVAAGVTYRTDADGVVTASASPGVVDIAVSKPGFVPSRATLVVRPGVRHEVVIDLLPEPAIDEEVTVVATTRTGKRLEDQPMRVEVLGRDEIEEKMLMTPGDIVMMLNEMGGMRVQATSPSLGAASVRIQGMRGRYTRVLSDGLPLFGEVGGLGLLQIPPMDLGQVEVIKGVASALYGAGAMAGIVNLLSRRPASEPEYEVLLNRSTRGATDAVGFLSGPLGRRWRGSLLGGGHWQEATDVDGDAWADLPGYSRAIVRPRVFWDDGAGRTLFATAGLTYEDRDGGTIAGGRLAATGLPYFEALRTRRYDGGALAQFLVRGRYLVTLRGAAARQTHQHQFGEFLERDRHDTIFGEAAIREAAGRHTWIAGLAFDRSVYAPRDVPRFAFAFNVPAAFAQYDLDVHERFAMSASGRIDFHSEYGTFFSPRISALLDAGRWTSRLSAGTGFFAPTPLTEETEAAGLTRLAVNGPLEAERGLSASFDLTRTDGPASYTVTLFASRIASPVHVDRSEGYTLGHLADPTTNVGIELLGTLRREPFAVTATYTLVRARETASHGRADLPLTPRHAAGLVAMWEREDRGRIGVEWYYTGVQRLEGNPYRTSSEPYVIVGILAERQVGRVRVFINGENLTGTRQSRYDPLLRRERAADGRWTVDAWAPLEGRTVNGGLRVGF